jgi:hypothetical protein
MSPEPNQSTKWESEMSKRFKKGSMTLWMEIKNNDQWLCVSRTEPVHQMRIQNFKRVQEGGYNITDRIEYKRRPTTLRLQKWTSAQNGNPKFWKGARRGRYDITDRNEIWVWKISVKITMYLVVGLAQSVPIRTSDLKSDIWPDDQHKSSPMATLVGWVEVCPLIMPNKKIFFNFSFNVLKFRTKLHVCSSHNSNNFPFLPCSTAYEEEAPSCMGFAPLVFYGATLFGWSYDCWINGIEKFFELFS